MFAYLLSFGRPPVYTMGMHLFLYQAARHVKPQWGHRRLSQTTIRSDFDLELLKRGIKGRYEIVGCGTHPWQAAMKKMGMEEEFYGHVIQIEDSKNAVWFKLNYDNIGKGVTKYLGGWRDLNPDHIAPHIAQYQLLTQVQRKLNEHLSTIRSQYYYLGQFISPRSPHHEKMLPAADAAVDYKAVLDKTTKDLEKELKSVTDKMAALQDQVRQYMKDHKG
jgi:hypothetical protein